MPNINFVKSRLVSISLSLGILILSISILFIRANTRTELYATSKEELAYQLTKKNCFYKFHYSENNQDYFASYSDDITELNFNNIKDEKDNFSIDLSTLKDSIEISPYSFFIHNRDSIFIPDEYGKKVALINQSGEVKRIINTINHEQNSQPYFIRTLPHSAPIFNENKLYLSKIKKVIARDQKTRMDHIFNDNSELVLNINGDSIRWENEIGKFPKKYRKERYRNPSPNRCLNSDGEMIYSFNADDYVYLYNDHKLIKKVKCKSQYINKFIPFKEVKSSAEEVKQINESFITEPQYSGVFYDKYRKRYYRIARHRIELTKDGIHKNCFTDKPWSIIVMDKDLKVMGEALMNQNEFYKLEAIIPDGLVVSKINKNNQGDFKSVSYITMNLQ